MNGVTAVLGTKVAAGDEVSLDGRPLNFKPERVYLALNKPIGIECTTDRDVPDNIVDFVGHRERIFPIGRLDKESEGLILLTNDGDIVNRVLRAEHEHEKEYIVSVDRPLTQEFLSGMAGGVTILETVTNPWGTMKTRIALAWIVVPATKGCPGPRTASSDPVACHITCEATR